MGGQQASLAFSGGGGAPPPPTPPPQKKNLAVDGGVGLAFAPECRAVRDRTERPQDEHGVNQVRWKVSLRHPINLKLVKIDHNFA
jgi:hypothetical protein